jgi:curved DNA-binding protein CbpA
VQNKTMIDYYSILEVPPTATITELRRSYRRLARKYHPDLNKQIPGNDQRIKRLNEAYDVLSDPLKRAAYDAQRTEYMERAERARQERLRAQEARQPQEPKMTWVEGVVGFVRELKKELQEE